MEIEIPANTESVTLNLTKEGRLTLRSVLPSICSPVMLCVNDESYVTTSMRAKSGSDLLRELERSRILDGEALLNLAPEIRIIEPTPILLNGSIVLNGDSVIQLCVTQPKVD